MYGTVLESGDALAHQLADDRQAYVHIARGKARINGQALDSGDGLAIGHGQQVEFEGIASAEILLFDMI